MKPDAEAPPPPVAPIFPEYGEGGDHAGARRVRRSFRLLVLASLLFTAALWFTENYLRYDSAETQYRMALTLHDDSARAVLRNVVRRDGEANEVPNARYLEALAFIEEPDVILERYQQAYRLNPSNPGLLINYGCRLFQMEQYAEARERFREAGVIQPPRNALTRYLEAAAIATDRDELPDALALVARANLSGDPLYFPEPLWHASLPTDSNWHAIRQRRIVDLSLAPLYVFKRNLVAAARQDIDAGHVRQWDSWLESLQGMGARLAAMEPGSAWTPTSPQFIAGIQFQAEAIALRNRIHELANGSPAPALSARLAQLDSARRIVQDFDAGRSARLEEHRERLAHPLGLVARGLAVAFGAYALAYLLSRLLRSGRGTWVLPHTGLCQVVLLTGLAGLLVLLLVASGSQSVAGPDTGMALVGRLWGLVLGAVIAFGVFYPAISLPPVALVVSRAAPEEKRDTVLPQARRSRRSVYVSLMRRYYGILAGGLLVTTCVWVLIHRVFTGIYPWAVDLALTGLGEYELSALQQAVELLR